MKLHQVTGPPGTGKTYHIARQAERAAEKYGPERVAITSLTKSAATEAAGRVGDVGFVGTLHALCYRTAGDRAMVLDSPKGLKVWSEWITAKGGPSWATGGGVDPDDPYGDPPEDSEGGLLLEELNLARHRMTPQGEWEPRLLQFAAMWESCKADLGATDFTGMIEAGLAELDEAPGRPDVLLGDEAQDWSRLEAALFLKWAKRTEHAVMVGDPDQAIYEWRGANPRIFQENPVPADQRKLLATSYRVPAQVHAEAQNIIRRIRGREDVAYAPTANSGTVEAYSIAPWKRPERWIEGFLASIGTTMLLAPCAYQLDPAVQWLKANGVPFHNPHRLKQNKWNPLGNLDGERKTGARQLAEFMKYRDVGWPASALQAWFPLLKADGLLAKGAKKRVQIMTGYPSATDFRDLFEDPFADDVDRALARDVDWLLSRCLSKDRRRLAYPARLVAQKGLQSLQERPKLTIGTIHSVKGGEADHVAVITALPYRWAEQAEEDWMCRLFYVAATRARQSLTWLGGDRRAFTP